MNILISGLFIFPKLVGGAENYFYNLLEGFKRLEKENEFNVLLQERFRSEYDPVILSFSPIFTRLKGNRILHEFFFMPQKRKGKAGQILFMPNYTAPLLSSAKTRTFATIHDLQYIYFPEFFTPLKRLSLRFNHKNCLKKCQKVIAISQNVKDSILENYGSKWDKKVLVIHNPVDFKRFSTTEFPGIGLESSPYILSVANHFPHKNILTLIRAFQAMYPIGARPRKLVLVGQTSDKVKGGVFQKYFEELNNCIKGDPDIIVTGFLSNGKLGWLYDNADIFVFPSKFEGFGIPVVEALGFGLPTITTSLTSIPEVSFGKAHYVQNADDHGEWAAMITKVLGNLKEEKIHFSKMAQSFREAYSPQKIAAQYYELFSEVNSAS